VPRAPAKARLTPPPSFIPAQLAKLVEYAPPGDDWLHEVKIDGYLIGARIAGGRVAMLTRKALDWTKRFGPIAEA
jgi:bifunctional non-homologous end joining protein LigD